MNEVKKDSLIAYIQRQGIGTVCDSLEWALNKMEEIRVITGKIPEYKKEADEITVTNEKEKIEALSKSKAIEQERDKLIKIIEPIASALNRPHKTVTKYRGIYVDELNEHAGAIDKKVEIYQLEVNAEQKRLQDEADRRALADEERIKETKKKQAENLKAKGKDAQAEQRTAEANGVHVPSVMQEITTEKVKTKTMTGSTKEVLRVEIIPESNYHVKLWLSSTPGGIDCLKIDETELTKYVNFHQLKRIPGLRITPGIDIKKRKRG